MSDLQKNQYNFADLKAEYVAKLKKLEDLLEKAAKLDIENQNMKHEIVFKSAQLEECNNVLIPNRNKLLNDTIDGHSSLLTSYNCNLQHRSRLATLIKTKIWKMNQEAEKIKFNIKKQEIEAQPLQATIEELKKISKQPQKQYEVEITKIQALQLVAEKREAELRKKEQVKEELIKATELNFFQVNDELQLLKQKYAEDERTMNDLERLRESEKDLANQKVNTLVEIEVLRNEFRVFAETSNTEEASLRSALEKLQADKDNLLAEQQAQHLNNDIVIANLQSQLKEVALANDVENISTFLHSQNSVRSDTSKKIQSSNRYLQSTDQQAGLPNVVRKTLSTPMKSHASTSNLSRLDLSPMGGVFQTPQQLEEMQPRFSKNNNERSAPRNLQAHSCSNASNK